MQEDLIAELESKFPLGTLLQYEQIFILACLGSLHEIVDAARDALNTKFD